MYECTSTAFLRSIQREREVEVVTRGVGGPLGSVGTWDREAPDRGWVLDGDRTREELVCARKFWAVSLGTVLTCTSIPLYPHLKLESLKDGILAVVPCNGIAFSLIALLYRKRKEA